MLLHRSDFIEAHYQEGPGSFLLITFAPLNFYADGKQFWGSDFGRKAGVPILGFIATGPNWYPRQAIEACLPDIALVLATKYIRVSYGASMGGFASLKHSRILGVTAAVSMAPQFSLDPAEIQDSANPFRSHFDGRLHCGMGITSQDLCDNVYLLYDPSFKVDLENACLITRQRQGIRSIKMLNCHHELARAFASTPLAKSFFNACANGEEAEVARIASIARKGSPIRGYSIAIRLMERHTPLSIRVFRSTANRLGGRHVVTYLVKLMLFCSQTGNEEAKAFLISSLPDFLRDNYVRRELEAFQASRHGLRLFDCAFVG